MNEWMYELMNKGISITLPYGLVIIAFPYTVTWGLLSPFLNGGPLTLKEVNRSLTGLVAVHILQLWKGWYFPFGVEGSSRWQPRQGQELVGFHATIRKCSEIVDALVLCLSSNKAARFISTCMDNSGSLAIVYRARNAMISPVVWLTDLIRYTCLYTNIRISSIICTSSLKGRPQRIG